MKKNKSVMNHNFATVPQANIPRSVFKRVSGVKTTFDEGQLIPLYVDEVLPGDTFNMRASFFSRLATPIKPIMDNMVMEVFWFFVPNRLVWDNWVNFMGEKDNPDDSTVYTVPQVVAPETTGFAVGSLFDYLGLPTGVPQYSVSALFSRAYNRIYNEWFRDQNLVESVVVDKDTGPDDPADYVVLKCAKAHDYFTSCLPSPQKGPGVELPLGEYAPVIGIAKYNKTWDTNSTGTLYDSSKEEVVYTKHANIGQGLNSYFEVEGDADNYPNIRADLSNATAATINSLREAFQIQRMYEKDARAGTRYVEAIFSHFGVVNPDFRLQRSEMLSTAKFIININTVPQTSVSASTPQGNLAGFGTVSGRGGFTKSFTEHGMIFCIGRVRADLTYQQGVHRMFSRLTKYDFYFPALAHLGEQAVLNKEIYVQDPSVKSIDGVTSDNDLAFGYQERWAEYRYGMSKITGKFRSTYAQSLDIWHLSQEFETLPELEQSFIEENAPMTRVIAVNTEPHFLTDCYYECLTTRPMPVYSVPGLIDHN